MYVRAFGFFFAAGCGFSVTSSPVDAVTVTDVPSDQISSDALLPRVAEGLVGFWTFDEITGTRYVRDTSGATPPVDLEVALPNAGPMITEPQFADGRILVTTPARLISATGTTLASACRAAGAVTLEVWLQPNVATQGTSSEPVFVAGSAGGITLRNIALLQIGDHWVGQIRTGSPDGKPNLLSTSTTSTTSMTHVVLVADSSQRKLYVDGEVEATSAPGSLGGWDPSYRFALVDEPQHARAWTGSMALVAVYARALSVEEVVQNFRAGPDASK